MCLSYVGFFAFPLTFTSTFLVRAKLAEKRSVQSKEDAQTQRENEKIRRKAGQEMGEAREEMKKKGKF